MSNASTTVGLSSSPLYIEASIRDYVSLLKPRVMTLVVFTGLIGLLMAPGNLHPVQMLIAVLCIALGSGAAGAFNMWIERDRDALMKRTMHRPLPAGRMVPQNAFDFALVVSIFSVVTLAYALNILAAALLLAAILFYVFVYTIWLKPRTAQNIVIGGAAGAFPPMIGWAASAGSLTLEPLLLFAIIFMWTPPHFWALSLYRCKDYAKAGIPMLPVVAGDHSTRLHIVVYTVLLIATTTAPYLLGYSGLIYIVVASALNIKFLQLAITVLKNTDDIHAKKLFGFSISYLFLLFSVLLIDHWWTV